MMDNFIIRKYCSHDFFAVSELWALVFGDSSEYINSFLNTIEHCGNGTVCITDDKIVSFAFLIDDLFYESIPCHYLYAVATHPHHRGKGFASTLIKECTKAALEQKHIILTSPAESSLVSWYEKTIAASPALYCSEKTYYLDELNHSNHRHSIYSISALEYYQIRERILAQKNHIKAGPEYLKIQEQLCKCYQGALIKIGNEDNIAAVYYDGDVLRCAELITANEIPSVCMESILAEYHAKKIICRLPGTDIPYVSAVSDFDINPNTIFNLILD